MADLGFLKFIALGLGAILVGLVIYIFVKIYGNKNEPRNEDIIINGLFDNCDGHGLLLCNKKSGNKNIFHINGLPRDIDYIKAKDDNTKIKDQDIFVRKDLLLPFNFSNHRNMKLALPDKPEHLPEDMDKDLKHALSYVISKKNANQDTLEVKEIREKNMLKMTKKTEGLEIAEEIVGQYSDVTKDIIKIRTPEVIPKEDGK